MHRYIWLLDTDGWPIERIDTLTGQHVPVVIGQPEEGPITRESRPIACRFPQVSAMVIGACAVLIAEPQIYR